jgi:hypothetical protein
MKGGWDVVRVWEHLNVDAAADQIEFAIVERAGRTQQAAPTDHDDAC